MDCARVNRLERPSTSATRSADRAEMEGPAGVFLEFDTGHAGALDGAFDSVDRGVEVLPGYLQG